MSETTSQQDAPLEVIGRYLDVMRSGDRETGYTFFAEDVSFHIPGRSRSRAIIAAAMPRCTTSRARSHSPMKARWSSS
jgi:hypothetical protein